MKSWSMAIAAAIPLLGCSQEKAADAPAVPVPEATPAAAPAPTTTSVPAGWTTWSDPAFGIAFDHAPGRRTGPCPEGETGRCVALYEDETHLMSFKVVEGTVEAVAAGEAGFERNDAGVLMTTYGRAAPVAVEAFEGPGWTGLKATIPCGISDENGFHAAAGDCLWAVVGDGRHAVVANTQGLDGLDPDTLRSLNSMRFVRAN